MLPWFRLVCRQLPLFHSGVEWGVEGNLGGKKWQDWAMMRCELAASGEAGRYHHRRVYRVSWALTWAASKYTCPVMSC